MKVNLIGLSRAELTDIIKNLDAPAYRANQLAHWIYYHGMRSFDNMINMPAKLRAQLADGYVIERPAIATAQVSTDGTQKWLLRFQDGQEAETVHIPDVERGTLCVSSQVGCTLTCKFCHTGTQKLVRNLTASEIVGQVMVGRDALGEWPTPSDGNRLLSNIVMMGMGEPLFNYDEVPRPCASS